jgi:aminomethyltransferase
VSDRAVRTSPLHVAHEALGCEFTEFDGFLWPAHFGDPAAEYWAVRRRAGIFDACPLPKLDFRGRDALVGADLVFTNDMLPLADGQARYAPMVDEYGKMVSDGIVYRLAPDRAWVMTTLESDHDHIAGITGQLELEIQPFTHDVVHIALQGPGSREVLGRLCSHDPNALGYFRFWPTAVEVAGVRCHVARTGYSGELGYELFCAPDDGAALWSALHEAGATPYGLAALEPLRIGAGLLFVGLDYTPHRTSPFDLSLDRVIVLDRGDFHGRDALRREAAHPPRRMVTLVLDADEVPPYGTPIEDHGRRVGTLTSPCRSPELDRVIGLAILETELARDGVELDVGAGRGRVAPFPISDPARQRPRG